MTEKEHEIILKDLAWFLSCLFPDPKQRLLLGFGHQGLLKQIMLTGKRKQLRKPLARYNFIINNNWIQEMSSCDRVVSISDPEYREKVKAYIENQK